MLTWRPLPGGDLCLRAALLSASLRVRLEAAVVFALPGRAQCLAVVSWALRWSFSSFRSWSFSLASRLVDLRSLPPLPDEGPGFVALLVD